MYPPLFLLIKLQDSSHVKERVDQDTSRYLE